VTDEPAMREAGGERPLVRVDCPATGANGALDGVALVTMDRPEALNALSFRLIEELVAALEALDADPEVRVIVLTGAGERAFAAGADVAEMASGTPDSMARDGSFERWDEVGRMRKPLIAAVRGFALGGGCELAMACDMIVAGDTAKFAQPEIKLGVIPGAGGTQRLPRAIGKARAMEMILTGRSIDAAEADRLGLVTQVVPAAETVEAALALAGRIAAMPPAAVLAAKAAVARAYEMPLEAGLRRERQAFLALFATEDQKEGMAAFLEKRKPAWRGR
jgi:enoyl-CoA hydratase